MLALAGLVAVGPLVVPGAAARDAARSVQALLGELGLGASELGDIRQRRAVSRTLHTADGHEIATIGAVHVRVPARFYLDLLKNIVEFKRHEAVQQIGTFGTPARVADVAALTFPPDDVEGLRRCRVQDCNIQLSSAAITRLRAEVPWHTGAAAQRANDILREVLVEVVNAYRSDGAAALMEYQDSPRPISAAGEFEAMVADAPAVLQRFPLLSRHVVRFPSTPAPGVEDLIYWSREKVGPSPVVSVTHMAFAPVAASPVVFAVASRQIYGSRYFNASLGLTLLLRDAEPGDNGADGTYVVYVNRSRVNALGGILGGLKRALVRSRTRSAMTDSLERARNMVERRFEEKLSGAVTVPQSADHGR